MTTEEKARAYDEALEIARKSWFDNQEPGYKHYREFLESMFRELREDEDEKLRKEIISALKFANEGNGGVYDKHIAYLEKLKKEPRVYDEKNYHQVKRESWNSYEPMKEKFSTEELFYKGFYEGYQFGIHEEKPHTWTKHDEAVRKEAITCLQEWGKNFPINGVDYSNILYWLKEELSVHTVKPTEKPIEWSDTNELVFKDICKHLKEEGYNGWIVLLNALRNGEFQPKQEWSEEDDLTIADLINYFEGDSLECSTEEMVQRIKSLRPTWKPGEDEERLINTSISFLKDFADKGYENAVECIGWLKSKLNGNSGK